MDTIIFLAVFLLVVKIVRKDYFWKMFICPRFVLRMIYNFLVILLVNFFFMFMWVCFVITENSKHRSKSSCAGHEL